MRTESGWVQPDETHIFHHDGFFVCSKCTEPKCCVFGGRDGKYLIEWFDNKVTMRYVFADEKEVEVYFNYLVNRHKQSHEF